MKLNVRNINKIGFFLAIVSIFFIIFILCCSNKVNLFNSVDKLELKEGANDDVLLDNWELSTVFYDSTVDDGKTPLTEINWEILDNYYQDDLSKVVTVQINYKNTNVVTTYEPGELVISIPNLMYYKTFYDNALGKYVGYGTYGSQISASLKMSANHYGQTNLYEWDFVGNSKNSTPNSEYETFKFTNANTIETGTNFEGSIQIEYTIRSQGEYPEEFDDSCVHEYHKNLQAKLGDEVVSNELVFNYKRLYFHEWFRGEYSFEKTAEQLKNFDNISLNSDDYYFVVYNFKSTGASCKAYSSSLRLNAVWSEQVIYDYFPEDTIVMNYKGEVVELDDNNRLSIDDSFYTNSSYGSSCYTTAYYIRKVIVAYPREKYNEKNGNLIITNFSDLYGKFDNSEELELLGTDDVTINLEEFEFTYSGDLYGIKKSTYFYQNEFYYQSIVGQKEDNYNSIKYTISPSTVYTGDSLTVTIGDDVLYATNKSQNYEQLADDDYFFSKIELSSVFRNGNSVNVPTEKYDCELWVRYANESEYKLYEKFKNKGKTWTFDSDDKVVGWYIKINDMTEGISYMPVYPTVDFVKKDIEKTGVLYNFAYLKVYKKDISGNLVLQNQATEEDYATFITKDEVATYDKDTYGTYVQRSCDDVTWKYYEVEQPRYMLYVGQTDYLNSFKIDGDKKEITGLYTISSNVYSYVDIDANYIEQYELKNGISGFYIYDFLPKGMEVLSTEEEIMDSIAGSGWDQRAYDAAGNYYYNWKLTSYIKKHVKSITITENYKNTGRTKVEVFVSFEDNPLFFDGSSSIEFDLNVVIPFSAYEEYGSRWTNYAYVGKMPNDVSTILASPVNDTYDLNNNGLVTDSLSYDEFSYTFSYLVGSYQDVTTYVQTDKSNYSTGVVNASYDSNYEYKLRVRTGSANVTNLIIYSNLEKAQSNRKHWEGEFLGVDTSYAESRGYTIKTYYSESVSAGILNDDTSWKEYNDTVDKTKVKSLAFEYLDGAGNTAILPANSLTYVLVKMKSPDDENIKTLAYNNCWTQWNALDEFGNPVDFITGINSNIVKISLPNSVPYTDIEIKLEKKWEDGNNVLGLRPSSIKYKLIENGDTEKVTEIILTDNDADTNKNIWSKTLEVPKYDDDGNVIVYTVIEDVPVTEGDYQYISTVSNFSITNTLTKELVITKKWVDNDNYYLTRPLDVTVQLLRNGIKYKDIVVTGEYTDNEWTKVINVPIYDELGNEYIYTLSEEVVEDYTSKFEGETFTLVNTLNADDKIKITKKWNDSSNKYNTRPESIIVKLKQNNKDYKTITLSESDDIWESDEIIVPRYDSDGVKYVYTIEEDVLVDGYGIIEYDQNNLIVTNTLKQNVDIIVTKKWLDGDNSYDTRPANLDVTLLQNGEEYKILTLSGDTNIWTTSVEVPKYDDNQEEYKYTIKEKNENIITEYSDVIYGDDGLTVTNRLNKKKDLTIIKKWIDYNNEYKTRSEFVNINLLQNGVIYKELKLTGAENTWTINVEGVPVYDENGVKYNYTIEEVINDKLKKYQKITYDQTNLTVTNELTEKPKVTLYFTVKNGYTEAGEDEVKFDEEGLKNVLEKHNINPDEEYLYKFELENIETGEKYEGSLSTQGILEFPDLPYGTYRAVEGEDEHFSFVNMLNIEDIPGVTFKNDVQGGIIEIVPTGSDIVYGVNVINKIASLVNNPPTESENVVKILMLSIIFLLLTIVHWMKIKKEF